MIAALQVLAIMQQSKEPLSKLAQVVKLYPQVLVNVEVPRKPPLETLENFQKEVTRVEKELKGQGRVLVRYSGTEPKARVMVEGPDEAQIKAIAQDLANHLKEEIGA
jgi:phosphoglucosamine mutase